MCSHLVHLAQTPVLTIDNMMLDLSRSSSFVPSWHKAAQLSYTSEELERLESLRVREFIHTGVYDVNLFKKGEMDVDLPTLFHAVGWSFVMRFLGGPLLGEGI
jgi:hypothetical protein